MVKDTKEPPKAPTTGTAGVGSGRRAQAPGWLPRCLDSENTSDYQENQKKHRRSPAGELNRRAREEDKAINVSVGGGTLFCSDTSKGEKVPIKVGCKGEPVIAGTPKFLDAMEEGFSTEETNQQNPFNTPEFEKANSETLAGRMQEVTRSFRLMLVELFLPKGYEVVESEPFLDTQEFCAQARRFWEAYEPLLGRGNTVTVLQVEAPAELEED